MNTLLALFKAKPHSFTGCTPPTPAERMARYSPRYAADMQHRENLGAGLPRARVVNGALVLVALPGIPNPLPKDHA